MLESKVSAVIVVTKDDEQNMTAVGLVSKTDLLRAIVLEKKDGAEPVSKIMTNGVVSINPNAPRDEAADVIMKQKVHHLIVTGESGKLIGIVSAWDIAREVTLDGKAWPYVRHAKK